MRAGPEVAEAAGVTEVTPADGPDPVEFPPGSMQIGPDIRFISRCQMQLRSAMPCVDCSVLHQTVYDYTARSMRTARDGFRTPLCGVRYGRKGLVRWSATLADRPGQNREFGPGFRAFDLYTVPALH